MMTADLRAALARQANIETAIDAGDYLTAIGLMDEAVVFLEHCADTTEDAEVIGQLVLAASYITEGAMRLARWV